MAPLPMTPPHNKTKPSNSNNSCNNPSSCNTTIASTATNNINHHHALSYFGTSMSPSKQKMISHPKIWLLLPVLALTFLIFLVYMSSESAMLQASAPNKPSSSSSSSSSSLTSTKRKKRYSPSSSSSSRIRGQGPTNPTNPRKSSPYVARDGIVGGVAFSHCEPSPNSLSTTNYEEYLSVVLLHGAAYTKQVWQDTGILHQLCTNHVHHHVVNNNNNKHNNNNNNNNNNKNRPPSPLPLAVTTLDLPVNATGQQLQQLLAEMANQNLIRLPLAALITPSASGKAVVDWALMRMIMIMQQQQQQQEEEEEVSGTSTTTINSIIPPPLSNFVSTWIPVASFAVAAIQPPAAIGPLFQDVDILAIYGDKDVPGKQAMSLLQQFHQSSTSTSSSTSTTTTSKQQVAVELPGRHPCYVDSPQLFVSTIVQHLEDEMVVRLSSNNNNNIGPPV